MLVSNQRPLWCELSAGRSDRVSSEVIRPTEGRPGPVRSSRLLYDVGQQLRQQVDHEWASGLGRLITEFARTTTKNIVRFKVRKPGPSRRKTDRKR